MRFRLDKKRSTKLVPVYVEDNRGRPLDKVLMEHFPNNEEEHQTFIERIERIHKSKLVTSYIIKPIHSAVLGYVQFEFKEGKEGKLTTTADLDV